VIWYNEQFENYIDIPPDEELTRTKTALVNANTANGPKQTIDINPMMLSAARQASLNGGRSNILATDGQPIGAPVADGSQNLIGQFKRLRRPPGVTDWSGFAQ
jgi:hypothetical protein